MTDEGDHPVACASLRERKKARTREALVEAALRLSCARGFEATTTEEIAAEADVSQRTLFRYFSTKEEVILSVQDEIEEVFRATFATRPADEHPFHSLTRAFTDSCYALGEHTLTTLMRVVGLYEHSPHLLAARLRRGEAHMELLAQTIAQRTGTNPDIDPRPRLVASAFGSAVQVAFDLYCRQRPMDVEELVSLVQRCLCELAPALTEAWHTTEADTSGT